MSVEPVKMTITKSTMFRGRQEEFSNVYTIHGLDKDSQSAMDALITAAVAAEKAIHATSVNFLRAQIFSYGSAGPNFMYESKSLSGAGSATALSSQYKECAVMMRAKMARSFSLTRSNQPYLRKYLHTCSGTNISDSSGASAPAWTTPPGNYGTYANFLENPGSGLSLTNDAGDEPIGSWEFCTFLEHRQFHKGRKEY